MCGDTKKFGLNARQHGHLYHVPKLTLDCPAFNGMILFCDMEEKVLAAGLCIFGDNP